MRPVINWSEPKMLDLTNDFIPKPPPPKQKFAPSANQQAIFNFIEDPKAGSAIVEAVAGSGKTTTIVEALDKIPAHFRTVFLAFNKSIAQELKNRVPSCVDVKTLNGIGHQTWCGYQKNVTIDASKTRKILWSQEIRDKFGKIILKDVGANVYKLVGIAKSHGLVPKEFTDLDGLTPDTPENWDRLIEHFDLQFENDHDKDNAVEVARFVLCAGILDKSTIDFDDQLYMSVIYKANVPKYDFVFVDEAQDVSDIQRALLAMALRPGGRLIAVGDPHQAIYGFRGADSQALNNIAKTFNATRLPLSISYRCAKAIVKEAQRFVSHIKANPSSPEGKVERIGEYIKKLNMFKCGDMVVCRCTAPLIKLAYALIAAKKPVLIAGRDIGKQIVALIMSFDKHTVDEIRIAIINWHAKKKNKMLAKDPEHDLSRIDDTLEAIETFIECSDAHSIDQLITSIELLFNGSAKDSTLLSTIHRSKGLEADRVFILDAHLMPIRYAKKPWQKEQEINLQYVAVTRAKSELYYIDSPEGDNVF